MMGAIFAAVANDNDSAVAVTLITSICSLIGVIFAATLSFIAVRRTGQTHELVNSRMTQFMAALKAEKDAQVGQATSDGILAGEQAQRDRSGPPNA